MENCLMERGQFPNKSRKENSFIQNIAWGNKIQVVKKTPPRGIIFTLSYSGIAYGSSLFYSFSKESNPFFFLPYHSERLTQTSYRV